ncbi:MAG: hypothetical protein RLY45_1709 [Actinomycetota bacterium]
MTGDGQHGSDDLPPRSTTASNSPEPTNFVDVVVIGAGLAGLRCAVDLASQGLDVVVVEARHRVGGRVWSHRFANGQVCERGAEFVDGHHAAVLGLAAELGLGISDRVSDVDLDGTLVDAGGRAVPMRLHATLADDVARWDHALHSLDPLTAPDDASLAVLIASLGLSAVSQLVVGRDVRTEFMLPPEEISQRFAAHVTAQQAAGRREVHRIVGGNDQLATGLARLCSAAGGRIMLGAPVAAVDADRGRVRLVAGEVLEARAVVAAVPVPVLARLWPDIPPDLAALGYGIGGKISIQFSRRLWRDLGRSGTVLSDRRWGHLWETTDDQEGDAGVLTNLLASHDGASFAALPEAPEQLLAEIDRLFPGARGLAGERVHTDWTNDPHSLGCYVCAGPGQWVTARQAMAEPSGRLWIAGEHEDEFTGYMEGALRSGRRTAARVAEAVG